MVSEKEHALKLRVLFTKTVFADFWITVVACIWLGVNNHMAAMLFLIFLHLCSSYYARVAKDKLDKKIFGETL